MLSNIVLNAIFVSLWVWLAVPGAHAGLALSSALAGYINAGLLLRWLRRAGVYAPSPGWGRFSWALAAAGATTATALWLLRAQVPQWPAQSATARVLTLAALLVTAAVVYLATAYACGLRPAHLIERPRGRT